MDHSWEMRGFTYPTHLPTCTGLKIYRVHRVGDHLHMRDDIMKTDPVLQIHTTIFLCNQLSWCFNDRQRESLVTLLFHCCCVDARILILYIWSTSKIVVVVVEGIVINRSSLKVSYRETYITLETWAQQRVALLCLVHFRNGSLVRLVLKQPISGVLWPTGGLLSRYVVWLVSWDPLVPVFSRKLMGVSRCNVIKS